MSKISPRGKKAKLLFSWDEYDRIRKIPVNVARANSDMEKYIGTSYADAPNPFGTEEKTYAEYFEREFEMHNIPLPIRIYSIPGTRCPEHV